MFYILGWKVTSKYYERLQNGEDASELKREFEVRCDVNLFILASNT